MAENLEESKISAWCIDYLATTLKVPRTSIDPQATFARLGLDSASSVFFLADLEDWLNVELRTDVLFEYPSIAQLARYLTACYAERRSPARRVP